jgi:Holliday junction resolvase RusA-like endonuclease
MTIDFQVFGVPIPKGSMKSFMRPGMRFPIVTHDNLKSKPWADGVRLQAQQLAPAGGPWDGAVSLHVSFYLPRPKSLPKKVVHPVKKPDLDKLLRNIKDSLKGVMYFDDSQVTQVTAAKYYANQTTPPCVTISLGRLS